MIFEDIQRLGEKGRHIIERDEQVMSGSIKPRYPFVMSRGVGARVWDVDGNEYIDFMAGLAVASTGHSHPKIVEAITQQAQKFIHIAGTDFYYEVQLRVAEKLAEIAPFEPARVFLANSGTETVEGALKMARWYTGRPNIIAFYGSFHGRSLGALSLTSSKVVQRDGFYPLLPGVHHVPYNNPYRCMHGREQAVCEAHCYCGDFIEEVLFKRTVSPDSVAAIVYEPVQGEGGYVVPDARFIQQLREICDKHDIILIADEVQTGIGRTGKWWASEHYGVTPDIICAAKGLASGMPIGAIIARAEVMSWPPGSHGNTFGGNPVSCAAALATLELIENGYMQNAAEQGAYIFDALEEMRSHHPLLKYARIQGLGLMVGAELVSDEAKTPAKDLRNALERRAIDNGLLLLGAGDSAVRFSPPLMIERPTVQEGLERFEKSLTEVEQSAGLL